MTATQNPKTERRNDVAIAVLQEQVSGLKADQHESGTLIKGHVDMCEKLHKRVLLGIAGLGLWSVAHSPEGYWTISKVAKFLLPSMLP